MTKLRLVSPTPQATQDDLLAVMLNLADTIQQIHQERSLLSQSEKFIPLSDVVAHPHFRPTLSAKKLRDDIENGLLAEGKHYINTSVGRGNYQGNVKALDEYYCTPAAKRA